MNTIIIHSNNRIRAPTLMHELNAALISPVSKWYRKPTPWWVDAFEEEGLYPILEEKEAETMMEDEEEDIDEEEEDLVLAGEGDVFGDTSLGNNDIPIIIVTSPSDGDLVRTPETVVLEFDHEDITNGTYKDYLLDASLYNWYMRFYSSTLAPDTTASIENDSLDMDLRMTTSTSSTDEESLEMAEVENTLGAGVDLVADAEADADEDEVLQMLKMAEVENTLDVDVDLVADAEADTDEDEVLQMLTESEAPSTLVLQHHSESPMKTRGTKNREGVYGVSFLSGLCIAMVEGSC